MHAGTQWGCDGGKRAQLPALHRQYEIRLGQHPQIDLAGGMVIQSKTIFIQQFGGHRMHAIADARGQARRAHVRLPRPPMSAQDRFRHGTPADIADTDNQYAVHRHFKDGVWCSLPVAACRACMRRLFTRSSTPPFQEETGG